MKQFAIATYFMLGVKWIVSLLSCRAQKSGAQRKLSSENTTNKSDLKVANREEYVDQPTEPCQITVDFAGPFTSLVPTVNVLVLPDLRLTESKAAKLISKLG